MYWSHLDKLTKSFHSPSVFETGLSDFHKLTLTVLKLFHPKHKPKIIQWRDFNHFDNASPVDTGRKLTIHKTFRRRPGCLLNVLCTFSFRSVSTGSFRSDLLQELSIQNVHRGEFEKFKYISSKVLYTYGPIKEKHVRCNQSSFMNKQLQKSNYDSDSPS